MDNVYKQFVTTYKTVQYRAVGSLTYMSAALALIMIMASQIIPAAVLILTSAAAFYFKRYLYVEYEYEFTNGEIDINKIVGKSKRKDIIKFNVKDVEVLAPENSKQLKAMNNLPKKEMKLYPITSKEIVYSAILIHEEKRLQLKFVPDKKLIELCYELKRIKCN